MSQRPNPTPEQAAAIDACLRLKSGQLALFNAYAGTGKTATLEMIGEAVQKHAWRALYVCYNADMAREAETRLPPNVRCKTSHSLAYASMMRDHPSWKSRLGNLRPRDLQTALRISNPLEAQAICDAFSHFLCTPATTSSPVDAINTKLVEEAGWGFLESEDLAAVVRGCRTVYRSIFEGAQPALAIPHDAYLWAYIYSKPVVPYDIILVDEGQDMNRLMIRFIEQQMSAGKRVVAVGDTHQGIYGWRLAVNALEILAGRATCQLSLTESFRFPQNIADAASRLLNDFKGDPVRLIGRGAGRSAHIPSQCFVARTNAGLVQKAASLIQRGERLHFAATREADGFRPTVPYKFEEIRDVYGLWKGQSPESLKTPWLRQFSSFESVVKYASPDGGENAENKGGDAELKAIVKLIEEYGYDTPGLLQRIEAASVGPNDASWCLSSAHRSKGKQWDLVTLSDDFLPLDNPEKLAKIREKLSDREFAEAVNLLYVAATRGKVRVSYPENCTKYFAGDRTHIAGVPAPKLNCGTSPVVVSHKAKTETRSEAVNDTPEVDAVIEANRDSRGMLKNVQPLIDKARELERQLRHARVVAKAYETSAIGSVDKLEKTLREEMRQIGVDHIKVQPSTPYRRAEAKVAAGRIDAVAIEQNEVVAIDRGDNVALRQIARGDLPALMEALQWPSADPAQAAATRVAI